MGYLLCRLTAKALMTGNQDRTIHNKQYELAHGVRKAACHVLASRVRGTSYGNWVTAPNCWSREVWGQMVTACFQW